MKILMCSVPDGSLSKTLKPLFPRGNSYNIPIQPLGILRLMTWIEKKGYSADIYDINNLRHSDEELIKNFKQTQPTVVGLSATLSHCYPNVKRITKILRELFPDIWIVVGGHVSASANVILRKTEIDICVVGDGEIPFVKLLDYFKLHPTRNQIDYAGLSQIKGLSFIDENSKIKVTGNAEQLPQSEMTNPDYDQLKVGLQKYGGDGELVHNFFEPMDKNNGFLEDIISGSSDSYGSKLYEKYLGKTIGSLDTSRGCVARCTFCQRSQKGYRPYTVSELENYVIDLKEKYNVGGFAINDENFGSNRKQSYEIARLMKKHDVYWMAGGVRCTSVNYEDLKFYKEHNVAWIKFGIESGSQQMLDIMEKKFKTEDVYNAISICEKVGVSTTVDGLMIGMPGETRETIIESAQFVASLRYLLGKDWNIVSPQLAMAIPGTPLYEYSQQIGIIGKTLDEEEDYLIRVSEHKTTHILNYVNKTNSNIKEVHYWKYLYPYAAKKEYLNLIIKKNKSIKNRLLQIYEKCIKGSLLRSIKVFNYRKKSYKNKPLLHKMKGYGLISTDFLLSLSVLFLPKAVLFSIVRVYANLRFNSLVKENKVKEGKQKHNFFTGQPADSNNNFRLTENRIAKANRPIERSLRSIVMDNRKKIKPAITEEEKGLQILAQGQ